MLVRLAVVGAAGLLVGCQSNLPSVIAPDRDAQLLRVAEYAVISGVAVTAAKAQVSNKACDQYVSTLVPTEELGLVVIGRTSSALGSESLVDLVRFAFDGSVSRDLNCYIAAGPPGQRIALLTRIDASQLRQRCLGEFRVLTAEHPTAFDNLPAERVCATTGQISDRVAELIRLLRAGESCGADW